MVDYDRINWPFWQAAPNRDYFFSVFTILWSDRLRQIIICKKFDSTIISLNLNMFNTCLPKGYFDPETQSRQTKNVGVLEIVMICPEANDQVTNNSGTFGLAKSKRGNLESGSVLCFSAVGGFKGIIEPHFLDER